jgi:O-antigen ligase
LPATFPLWSVDEFTGRSRLSVFGTFPGTMGETAAYLILLAPVFFRSSSRGSYWISRLFLLFINLAAGGKLSSAVLLLLLGVEYLFKIRSLRSWRVVVLVNGVFLILCVGFYVSVRGDGLDRSLGRPLEMIYGQDVAAEADSLDGRVDLWRGTGDLIIDNPVLGYGFDGARNVLMNIAEWSGSSHNGFLELALSGGAIGLVFFLAGLGAVFRACLRSASDLRRRTLTVFAYMIFIAFTGVTFNFPSYFGFLILTLLFYRSVQFSTESVSSPAYLEITPPVAG